MHNIAVDAVVVPAGGHGDEKPVRPFNHFNVVQGDCIVQRDGYDCAQPAVMLRIFTSVMFIIKSAPFLRRRFVSAPYVRRCVCAQS